MTDQPGRVHTATCAVCSGVIGWIDCPTGGWWAHEQHPADDHDARLDTAEVTLPAALLDDLETWLLARRWTLRQRPMDARAWYAVPVIGETDDD
jgi:hypothetical protein